MPRVTPSPQLAAALGPIVLPDPDGVEVRLGDLWRQRSLLLVHLRHFG